MGPPTAAQMPAAISPALARNLESLARQQHILKRPSILSWTPGAQGGAGTNP